MSPTAPLPRHRTRAAQSPERAVRPCLQTHSAAFAERAAREGPLLPADELLLSVAGEISSRLSPEELGLLIRRVIDARVDTPRTNRLELRDLAQSEKTGIGTDFEIAFRETLGLEQPEQLDVVLAGVPVDIKWSISTAWMIPQEAYGHPCILVALDEDAATARIGVLAVDRSGVGLAAANRDTKRGVRSDVVEGPQVWGVDGVRRRAPSAVHWVYTDVPVPANELGDLSPAERGRLLAEPAGPRRIAALLSMRPSVRRDTVLRLDVPDIDHRQHAVNELLLQSGTRLVVDPETGEWGAGAPESLARPETPSSGSATPVRRARMGRALRTRRAVRESRGQGLRAFLATRWGSARPSSA